MLHSVIKNNKQQSPFLNSSVHFNFSYKRELREEIKSNLDWFLDNFKSFKDVFNSDEEHYLRIGNHLFKILPLFAQVRLNLDKQLSVKSHSKSNFISIYALPMVNISKEKLTHHFIPSLKSVSCLHFCETNKTNHWKLFVDEKYSDFLEEQENEDFIKILTQKELDIILERFAQNIMNR